MQVREKLAKQRHIDTLWNKKYGTQKLGEVPDFDALHARWESKLAAGRRQRQLETGTVPQVCYCLYVSANSTQYLPSLLFIYQRCLQEKVNVVQGTKSVYSLSSASE